MMDPQALMNKILADYGLPNDCFEYMGRTFVAPSSFDEHDDIVHQYWTLGHLSEVDIDCWWEMMDGVLYRCSPEMSDLITRKSRLELLNDPHIARLITEGVLCREDINGL